MDTSFKRAVPLILVLLVLIPFFFIRLYAFIPGVQRATPTPTLSPTLIPTNALGSLDYALAHNRPVQALYHIEAQAAQTGWTPVLFRLAGNLWRDMGDMTRAVRYWEAALPDIDDNIFLARAIAQAYLDMQRWTEARDALTRLLDLSPEDLWAHYQLGLLLAPFDPQAASQHLWYVVDDPAYADVSRALLLLLAADPDDPLISLRVGIRLAELELWPYAELALTAIPPASLDGDSLEAEALAYAGLARDKQGKDGSQLIQQALALEPENPQVIYLYGLHLRTQEEYQASLDMFVQAVALDPENPYYYADLATAHRLVGHLAQAEQLLKQAAAISGYAPEFLELLALFYADEAYNLSPETVNDLLQLAEAMSDNPDILAAFGWALHLVGETEAGLVQLDAALAINPDHPLALYNKARILVDEGDIDNALPYLRRVAASDSEYADDAQRILIGIGE